MALIANRLIAPLAASRVAVAETLLLPALTVGLGIWLNPLDPLGARAAFPWAWFAPVVLALRYGPFAGLFGGLLYVLAWFALQHLGFFQDQFPKLFFLGGLIAVMLCGEFSSIWRARVRRAEAMQIYLDQRLEFLTHQHYLLRLSHDRLEQDLISRPVSMRDALSAMRALVGRVHGTEALPGGSTLLRLLAQYCQLEQAGLFAIRDGIPEPHPASFIGQSFQLQRDDQLVKFALANERLCHVETPGVAAPATPNVIAAPMISNDDRLYGVLVVARVPFFALHDEMLQTLNLLLGYYTDGLDARATAQPVLLRFPDCPVDFAFELQRLWRIRTASGVKSAMVALMFAPRPGYDDLAMQMRRQQRSLDVTWLIGAGARSVLVTLMPLSSTVGAEGYLNRIEEWVKRQTAGDFASAGISSRVFLVDELAPVPLLQQLIETCDVPREARTVGAGA